MEKIMVILLVFCNVFYSCNEFEYKKHSFGKKNNCNNDIQFALYLERYHLEEKVDRRIYYKQKGLYVLEGAYQIEIREKRMEAYEHIEYIKSLRKKNKALLDKITEKIRIKMRKNANSEDSNSEDSKKNKDFLINMAFIEKEIIELRSYNVPTRELRSSMQLELVNYVFDICNFFDKYDFKNKNDKIPINLVENYIICVYLNQNTDYLDYLAFIPNGIDYPYL